MNQHKKPLIFNLRRDPYERAEITSNTYFDWLLDRAPHRRGARPFLPLDCAA